MYIFYGYYGGYVKMLKTTDEFFYIRINTLKND